MEITQLITEDHSLLSTQSPIAEEIGALTPIQLDIIYSNKWFKLFVPEEFGGLGLSVPDGVHVEEELARIDGSLGWTCTLCSGASMFVGYLEPDWRDQIFSDRRACLAGSGRPNGIAVETDGGYVVTGRWDYASGAAHTTVFTANCRIFRNGSELITEEGTPVIRSFSFRRDEVLIHNNWSATGLKATSGHSFEVKDLKVSHSRTFLIDSRHSYLDHPIFNYPFQPFAEITTAVNSLGIGFHFLEVCRNLGAHKTQYGAITKSFDLMEIAEKAERNIASYRSRFYDLIEASWNECLTSQTVSANTCEAINQISKEMVRVIRREINELYPYCGMQAANPVNEINRIWRDLYTASQHSLLL